MTDSGYGIFAIICLVLGGAGASVISRYGLKIGVLDHPNERSSHRVPVPKGGGIGIFVAFTLFCLLAGIPMLFWLPISLIAILGLYVDHRELSPTFRLCLEFAAAALLVLGVELIQPGGLIKWVIALLWILYIAGTINFYNFMDGINGIAGITGVIAFGLLAFFAYSRHDMATPFVFLPFCLSLSCAGFLPWNMPAAKVFMGDAGSYLLGFAFAGLVFLFSRDLMDFICLASFLFPFYADELTTMVVRIKDRENLAQAHRRHLYQLLANEKGISHWKVSLGYGLFQSLVGVTVLMIRPYGIVALVSFLLLYFLGFTWISFGVRRQVENSEPKGYAKGNSVESLTP